MNAGNAMPIVGALLVSLGACRAVDIAGKITLKGNPPPETLITFPAGDMTCGKLHPIGLKTRFYVLGPDGGLADPFLHNVHATPAKDCGNEEVNQAQLPGGKDFVKVFEHPEIFLRVKCDVHNWMFAYIGVVDHPYFAVSGKDGTYRIANLPPGTYTVEAYRRKAGKVERQITVGPENVRLDFTLELKPR